MGIQDGDVIKIDYQIRFKDNTIYDSSKQHGGPIKLHIGTGQILRSFEKSILGMEVGDEKSFILEPSEAYGEFNPLLIEKININTFPPDMSLELGKKIEVIGPNGMSSSGWIRLIEDNYVIVDMNHPCAGQTLKFKVKIIESGLEADEVPNPFALGFSCGCGCDHH